MSARKRKANNEPAITVYKRVDRTLPHRPEADPHLIKSSASRVTQEAQLVVTSVELAHRTRHARAGFEHYLQLQGNPPEHESRDSTMDCESNTDSEEEICSGLNEQAICEPVRDRSPAPDIDLNSPPIPRHAYYEPMFAATTYNPAVFLAITCVAQRNLSFLNFDSALNHIPNHPAALALPDLKHGVFVDDMQHKIRQRDVGMHILFLPQYYIDGRHALGYFALPADHHDRCVTTCLFTPCTNTDLEIYNLIELADDSPMETGIGEATEWTTRVEAVGARNGRWLEYDVVEDWDKWNLGLKVVKNVWSYRFEVTTGLGEGGDRWKP